jgi:hypothetical protein
MMGSGRTVRIPFPPAKAGLKKPPRRGTRSGRIPLPRFRLRSRRANATRLREKVYEEALLFRSWIRWSLLGLLWIAAAVGALQFPLDRFSVPHFGLIVVGFASFVAGFQRHRAARTAASVLILVAAGMFASVGESPEVALGLGLPGLGLMLLNSVRL